MKEIKDIVVLKYLTELKIIKTITEENSIEDYYKEFNEDQFNKSDETYEYLLNSYELHRKTQMNLLVVTTNHSINNNINLYYEKRMKVTDKVNKLIETKKELVSLDDFTEESKRILDTIFESIDKCFNLINKIDEEIEKLRVLLILNVDYHNEITKEIQSYKDKLK